MKMETQKFGFGDIAMLDGIRVRVVDCIFDDEIGKWFYEVEPVEFTPPKRFSTREVPQKALKKI